jgi:hypothetical protein
MKRGPAASNRRHWHVGGPVELLAATLKVV